MSAILFVIGCILFAVALAMQANRSGYVYFVIGPRSILRQGSKACMNRLVGRTTVPTIWIANDVGRLGPAIIRRMNLALRFPKPRLSVRKAMVARIAKGHGMRLDDASAGMLARAQAAPALIENAIRSATQIAGSARDAAIILSAGLRALGRTEPLPRADPDPVRPGR